MKELIIAEELGHRLIVTKHDADACDPDDPTIKYEYLSCKEGGTGQLDRMYKEPAKKRKESLARISRNRHIYFAVFYKVNQIQLKAIYKLEPNVVLKEARRKLSQSSNTISHIGFSIRWAAQHGELVYEGQPME